MAQYVDVRGMKQIVHGFVLTISRDGEPSYFTGASYSKALDDARTYRTARGAMHAFRCWENADYNDTPLGPTTRKTAKAIPVRLQLA
jgi:hypothetical protein